jgi:hypothetical protein
MHISAVDWTAVGSISAATAAIAAFLTILITVGGSYLRNIRNKVATAQQIRQSIQFINAQQEQVLRSIEQGLPAIIDMQMRGFRERFGSTVTSSYFLDQLFNNYPLFRASAMDSNLSSTAYSRMTEIWNEIDTKAREFRGALRVFSYACGLLIREPYSLSDPSFMTSILDIMAQRGVPASLSEVENLDQLVNELLSEQVQLATKWFSEVSQQKILQGNLFIGILADMALSLPDSRLLKLSSKNVPPPTRSLLEEQPFDAIRSSIGYLQPQLSGPGLNPLLGVLDAWEASSAVRTDFSLQGPARRNDSPRSSDNLE